jgi:DNA-directed RNA polymerase sigma subunit (sigma70/sigma32)
MEYLKEIKRIATVVKLLTIKEREVILRRYGLLNGQTKTLESVGKDLKISRERVRQLETAAFAKFRIAYAVFENEEE